MNTFDSESTNNVTRAKVKIYISGKRKRTTCNANSTERLDFV